MSQGKENTLKDDVAEMLESLCKACNRPSDNSHLELLGTNWWEILNTHTSIESSLITLENSMDKDLALNIWHN